MAAYPSGVRTARTVAQFHGAGPIAVTRRGTPCAQSSSPCAAPPCHAEPMSYLDRVVGSILLGLLGTLVLLMVSIAVSWGFGLTWHVPFVLWVEAHKGVRPVRTPLRGLDGGRGGACDVVGGRIEPEPEPRPALRCPTNSGS
jgi:hypothetical protein